MRRRAPVLVAVVAGVSLVAGCTTEGSSEGVTASGGDAPETGTTTALSPRPADAELPPCPESTDAEPVADGLPDLTLECLGDGSAVTLSGLRGTPLVVNVWSSWCDPCINEMPRLETVRKETEGRVRFLGINFLDAAEPAAAAVRDTGMGFPSVSDPQGKIRTPLRVPGPPTTFFVTADGRIAHVEYGEMRSADEIRDLVDRHLGVRP